MCIVTKWREGRLAQLEERFGDIEEVASSSLASPTILSNLTMTFRSPRYAPARAAGVLAISALLVSGVVDPSSGVRAADGPQPGKPVVFPYKGDDVLPEIRGTWDHSRSVSLRVSIEGSVYELGRDGELQSDDAGFWILVGPRPGPGIHDVAVETVDAAGNVLRDETRDEIQLTDPEPSVELAPITLPRAR